MNVGYIKLSMMGAVLAAVCLVGCSVETTQVSTGDRIDAAKEYLMSNYEDCAGTVIYVNEGFAAADLIVGEADGVYTTIVDDSYAKADTYTQVTLGTMSSTSAIDAYVDENCKVFAVTQHECG